MSKTSPDSFSKLRSLVGKVSPKSLLKTISNPMQAYKTHKQTKEIESKLSTIDKRNAELEQKQVQGKETIKNARIEALKKLYAMMQQMGVDPNNLDSIAQFREKLMQEDPDLWELFDNAFSVLTEGLDAEQPTPQPQNLMNQATTNLQQGIMRQ